MQGCKETVLIADIGGTNCRFELWRIDSSGREEPSGAVSQSKFISSLHVLPYLEIQSQA